MKEILLILVILLCSSNVKAQTEDFPMTFSWKPLSAFITQEKTSKVNTALSILTGRSMQNIKRTIERIDKSTKIYAVALKNNYSGSVLKSNKFVYLSEYPNEGNKGSFSINTVRLSINDKGKKIKLKDLDINKIGWAVYKLDTIMYLCDADDGAIIENVEVCYDNGNGQKVAEVIKDAEIFGTADRMEAISKMYEDGKLSYINLEGYIFKDQELAKRWKSKADVKRIIEKSEEEKKRKEVLERERKAAEERERQKAVEEAKAMKEKKERENAVNKLRVEMNKKYGKKYVDAMDKGDIIVGMHEDLVALVCYSYGIDLRKHFENGRFQEYYMYALRVVNTGFGKSEFKMIWIGTIGVENHKVTSIIRGKRWSG